MELIKECIYIVLLHTTNPNYNKKRRKNKHSLYNKTNRNIETGCTTVRNKRKHKTYTSSNGMELETKSDIKT